MDDTKSVLRVASMDEMACSNTSIIPTPIVCACQQKTGAQRVYFLSVVWIIVE